MSQTRVLWKLNGRYYATRDAAYAARASHRETPVRHDVPIDKSGLTHYLNNAIWTATERQRDQMRKALDD